MENCGCELILKQTNKQNQIFALMKKLILLIFWALLVLSLQSCSDSTTAFDEELDDNKTELEPGEGTYSVSGVITANVTGTALFYYAMFDNVVLFKMSIFGDEDRYDLEFEMFYQGNTPPGTGNYVISRTDWNPKATQGVFRDMTSTDSKLYTSVWSTHADGAGTLIITEITEESLKGTFEFEAHLLTEEKGTEVIQIKEGRFYAVFEDFW